MDFSKNSIYFGTLFIIILFSVSCLNLSSSKKTSTAKVRESQKWNIALDLSSNCDNASAITVDSDNNVYISGLIGNQPYLKKFNSDGIEITENWNKKIDVGVVSDIISDKKDNIFVVGTTFGALEGESDWWIKKYDSHGNEDTIKWDKRCDFSKKNDSANAIAIDNENNIYVVGDCYNNNSGFDWWIKKFNINGKELWEKRCDLNKSTDLAKAIAIDTNNNIYVVGSGFTDKANWWIKKFYPNGVEDKSNWNKIFSSKTEFKDSAYSISIDSDNNIYIAGSHNGSPFNDWWIKKFDSSGDEDTSNWNKIIDGNGFDDEALSIVVDSNNDIYVAGYGTELVNNQSNTDWWIKKFNNKGKELWDYRCDARNDNDTPSKIGIDKKNDLYVIGSAKNLISKNSEYDWWLKKFETY